MTESQGRRESLNKSRGTGTKNKSRRHSGAE